MAPAPRDDSPGVHHVWVNATGNWPYYVDELDRMVWLRILVEVIQRCRWVCLAFCQMTTHVHLLLAVEDLSLPAGMQRLNRAYTRHFNLRHDRVGCFVRKRYGNRRISDGTDLLGAFAYVVLNPVREGMCPRAEDWRWSSFATTIGLSNDFAFVDASLVLDELGGSVAALRDLVAAQQERLTVSAGQVR